MPVLTFAENILVNVPFNATAHADSRDSIIFDNTPRLYIKTKRYHKIHWLQLERDSKGKCVQIGSDRQEVGVEPRLLEARRAFGGIIEIHFPHLASVQLRRRTAKMLMSGDGHRL